MKKTLITAIYSLCLIGTAIESGIFTAGAIGLSFYLIESVARRGVV